MVATHLYLINLSSNYIRIFQARLDIHEGLLFRSNQTLSDLCARELPRPCVFTISYQSKEVFQDYCLNPPLYKRNRYIYVNSHCSVSVFKNFRIRLEKRNKYFVPFTHED